jgi:hypothetical protein
LIVRTHSFVVSLRNSPPNSRKKALLMHPEPLR